MAGNNQNVIATAWVKIIPTFSGAEEEVAAGVATAMAGVKEEIDGSSNSANKLKNTFNSMRNAGVVASATISAPIAALGKSSIQSAVEFENTFSYMGSILDDFSGDMGSMKQTAIDTAKNTIFGVQEVADAMVILGKAGLDEANIKGQALQSTLNLAAAAEVDLGEAADSTVRAMNAFGLSGNDTVRVADALTYSANASTAEVHDLMLGLQQASTAASVSGWTLEETVGTLAMFTDQGIKGSDAGTSLKTMLRRLQAPTENAQMAMDELGLQIYDDTGKMVSFESIIGQLESSMASLTEEERNRALAVIFGSDASRAAMQLMQATDNNLQHYIATQENAGIAEEQARARYSETGYTIERMNNSIEAARIALGQALMPIVTQVAEGIAGLATWFSNLPEPVRTVIGVVGGLIAAVGPVLAIIGTIGSGLMFIMPIIGGVGSAILGVISPLGAVAAAVVLFLTATEPGQAILTALGEALGWVGDRIGEFISWIGEGLGGFFNGFAETLVNIGDGIAGFGDTVGQAFDFLVSAAQWAIGDVKNFFGDLGNGIGEFASNAQQFMSNAGKAFDDFKTNAGQALANAASAAQSKAQEIGSAIKGGLDTAAQNAKSAWDNMSSIAASAGDTIRSRAVEAFNGIANGAQEKIAAAKAIFDKGVQTIGQIFSAAKLQLPQIKLPHFSISGNFSLNPISIPHISVQWYKSGGIALTPSIVGVGEAGPEAIVPLSGPKFDELTDSIADKVKANGVIVNVSELVVREEADVDRIANRLAQLTRRKSMTGVYA